MRHVSNELVRAPFDPPVRSKIRHPSCITCLLHHGIPDDTDNEKALSIIAQYALAKDLDETQGERMVQTMMHNTPSLSAGKRKKLQKRTQAHLAKGKNRGTNALSCRIVLSSKGLRERNACNGWQCEYYTPDEGWEPYLRSSSDEARVEQAILTYVLNHPESVTEGVQLKLTSESFVDAFICGSGVILLLNRALWHICCYLERQDREIQTNNVLHLLSRHSGMQRYLHEITRYVQDVATRIPCGHDVFLKYALQVREREAEQRMQALMYAASLALRSHTLPPDIILHTLQDQAHKLSLTIGDVIHKLDGDLAHLVTTFIERGHRAIPTSSSWLNTALGGGWKPGGLYAVYASCDAEAADFAAWCMDQAAWRAYPTLHVNYGKRRDDMGFEALARYSGIEANELSAQRGRIYDSAEDEAMLERLISGGARLSKRIAQHIWTLEADDQTATADIMRAARAVQHHGGSGDDKPVLLLIDHLSATASNGSDGASGCGKEGLSEGHFELAKLKRSVSNSTIASIVFFVTDTARNRGGLVDSTTLLECLKGGSAADCTLILRQDNVEIAGLNGKKIVDQLDITREWYKRRYCGLRDYIQRYFNKLRGEYPAEATHHYTRLLLCKTGGPVLSSPLLLYEPTSHQFQPVDIEAMDFEEELDRAL
ncbi:MAG: hypothetical protein ACXV45_07115 [Halobacteriota archaeon]